MPLALRLAARELRSGVRGFGIFLACLALGVAAIAAAGSTAEAFRQGLASQAREILGGDLAITIEQSRFTSAERAVFAGAGRVSYAVAVNAMAQAPSGERRLVELRGVDAAYPLAGTVRLQGGDSLARVLSPIGGTPGAAVEEPLMDRLGLKLGDRFLVGNTPLVARAILISEPDRLSRGFALGPRVLTTAGAVESGDFLSPGVPFGETARIALSSGENPRRVAASIRRALPDGDLRIRERNDAARGARRMIDQLEYFLGFIGLASLVAGGLGVWVAVSAYLETRKDSIAVLKVLGATGVLVRNVYLAQIALLAGIGIAIGLFVGAVTPLVLGEMVKRSLPVPALFAIYPWPLVKAGAFGLMAAAAFSLLPIARARATSPASLMRRELKGRLGFTAETIGALAAAGGLAALSVAVSPTPPAAAVMIAGVSGAFVTLWALGAAGAWLAGGARGGARGPWRIGLANLAGPRSAARTATPAIGLGMALLSSVVLIQSSLLAEIDKVAPRSAPALVFTGIPGERGADFDRALASAFGRPLSPATYLRAPFATGRIVAVRGITVDRRRIDPSARWAYDNDIGISAIGPQPRAAGVVAGRWWNAKYAGPPVAALADDAAKGTGLKPGDMITLDILGRRIDARVDVLRTIDFAGFGASFPIVLDPAALEGANLANVAIAKATPQEVRKATLALGVNFPEVNVISVREALEAASDLFGRLALAVRAAASVAALAGLLVLTGAIAAGARGRAREAATLKVLGASSSQIIAAYAVEYGAVGVIAGVAGVALGYAAAWPVVVQVFRATWSVDWTGVAALIGGAAALAAFGGVVAAVQALRQPIAPVLRQG